MVDLDVMLYLLLTNEINLDPRKNMYPIVDIISSKVYTPKNNPHSKVEWKGNIFKHLF